MLLESEAVIVKFEDVGILKQLEMFRAGALEETEKSTFVPDAITRVPNTLSHCNYIRIMIIDGPPMRTWAPKATTRLPRETTSPSTVTILSTLTVDPAGIETLPVMLISV